MQKSGQGNTGPLNSTIKTDNHYAKKRRIEQPQNGDPLNLLNIKTDNQHAKQRRIQQRLEQAQYTDPLNLINMCTVGNDEQQVEQRSLKKAEQEREAERKQRENREQIPRKYRDQIEAQRRLELIRNPDPLNLMGQCTVNIYDSRYQEILTPPGQADQVITRERRLLMCQHWQERKDSIKGDLFPDDSIKGDLFPDAMEMSHFEEKHNLQYTGPPYDSPSYLGEGDLPRLRPHNLW